MIENSIFHRTPEGNRACDSGLPEAHRAVLQCVGNAMHFDAIAARLAHRTTDEVARCLDDLEAIGLVESIPLEWLVELYMLERYEPEPLAHPRRLPA
jgi:hypothetical protein